VWPTGVIKHTNEKKKKKKEQCKSKLLNALLMPQPQPLVAMAEGHM
jgi:hypothetical protein